jgi:hypothetical protein
LRAGGYLFVLIRKVLTSRRNRLAVLAMLAVGLAAAFAVESLRGNGPSASVAQLAAHNYRILSRHDSRSLIRFAEREYRCLAAKGVNISAPVASRARITMRAPGQSAPSLARLQLQCDPRVGPPPAEATLQARSGQVLVFLPKRCLMDPTVSS